MTKECSKDFSSLNPQVEFIDVREQYDFNTDVVCNYSLDDYTQKNGDRIAIFALGWQNAKDFVVFEWAEKDNNSVTFSSVVLPKNPEMFYQFCYISGENTVRGASKAFEFYTAPDIIPSTSKPESGLPISVKSVEDDLSTIQGNPTFKIDSSLAHFTKKIPCDKDKRILELETQVSYLRDLLWDCMFEKKASTCACKKDVAELKECILTLTDHVQIQAKQIAVLKRNNETLTETIQNFGKEKEKRDCDTLIATVKGKLQGQSCGGDVNGFGDLESLPNLPQICTFPK